jgi:hypothetical protein
MNPIHIPKHYFPKIHLNVIHPSTPRSSQWSPPFRPPNQNVVCTSHLPNLYEVFVVKPLGKKLRRRVKLMPTWKYADNIKMDLRRIGYEDVD